MTAYRASVQAFSHQRQASVLRKRGDYSTSTYNHVIGEVRIFGSDRVVVDACLRLRAIEMDEAFIIMQIGDAQMDAVCDEAFAPAIEEAGLVPRRVDRHNEGDLLKSEIVRFLERSQIIVADVTNERPNCYLEIGYAMGLGKKANLILTAREDHFHSHPAFDPRGPKVHFDLEGYDILFWSPEDLPKLREELTQRVRRRLTTVRRGTVDVALPAADGWSAELRSRGLTGLEHLGKTGYLEVAASIRPTLSRSPGELRDAVQAANVHAFGWPIGVTLDNRDEYRPRPTSEGIVAEVTIERAGVGSVLDRDSYDLWMAFRDGRFYTMVSLFEDERVPETIFWDIRTVRVAEALVFLARLYRRLEASDTDEITVSLRHAGLEGRTLRVADQMRFIARDGITTTENSVETEIRATLVDIETNLVGYVKQIMDPLLVVFDFYEVREDIFGDVIEKFLAREPGAGG
jgi:hypothetical protein